MCATLGPKAFGPKLGGVPPSVDRHRHRFALSSIAAFSLPSWAARLVFLAARRLLEEALPHHQAAPKTSPRNPYYLRFYRNNRWRLAETLLELKDHAVIQLDVGPDIAPQHYDFAPGL